MRPPQRPPKPGAAGPPKPPKSPFKENRKRPKQQEDTDLNDRAEAREPKFRRSNSMSGNNEGSKTMQQKKLKLSYIEQEYEDNKRQSRERSRASRAEI